MVVYVRNIRKEKKAFGDRIKNVYIGRGSLFGNRFKINRECNRHMSILAFKNDLDNQSLEFWKNIEALKLLHKNGYEINLWCYCSPLACHGDVLKGLIEDGS